MSGSVQFHINDKPVEAKAEDAELSLLEFLHERQDLTGTKFCCGIGVCHACTVGLRNSADAPMNKTLACSTPVSFLEGMRVYTVEGLGTRDALAPLQQAFLDHFAFQCGYCAPGFLMAATALLDHLKMNPVDEQELDAMIREWIGGNICRCTGYVRYLQAIRDIALPYTRRADV